MYVSDLPAWAIRAFAFLFGALWGSFFNVAIYRWPRDMSVVSPPSHCPACGESIPAWRNVPLLGFLLLRGRAACCGAKMTPRYFLVELASGMLCMALAQRYMLAGVGLASLADTSLTTLLFFAFVGGLLIATFVDLEWMEIPDEVSIGGTALGLATVAFRSPGPDALDVALGAGGAYLLVQLLLVWSWERMTGRRGMGEGDSKLLMFIGAFLGWKGALFALVAGAFQGIFAAAITLVTGRRIGPSIEDGRAGHGIDAGHGPDEAPPPDEQDDTSKGALSMRLEDGTQIERDEPGRHLEVKDRHGRLIWEYLVIREDPETARRKLPFGPFLGLAALEFLFFGEPLIDAYLELFN